MLLVSYSCTCGALPGPSPWRDAPSLSPPPPPTLDLARRAPSPPPSPLREPAIIVIFRPSWLTNTCSIKRRIMTATSRAVRDFSARLGGEDIDTSDIAPLCRLTLATALACCCDNSSRAASRAASRATASSSETRLLFMQISQRTHAARVYGQSGPIARNFSTEIKQHRLL